MRNSTLVRLCNTVILFLFFLPVHAANQESPPLMEEEFFGNIPVVLTATRLAQPATEAPAAVTVIDREMIKASGAREVADLFQLVPGFVVSHDNGYTPIVMYHGLSDEYARRMQVLIDGRSVYSPSSGGVEWTNLPLTVDDIQRIEVIRGPNAASYGSNSFLSIINIITFHAIDTTGTYAKISKGSDNITDAYLRYGNTANDLSYRLSLGYNHEDGFEELDDDRTVRLARLRADYQFNPSNSILFQMGANNGPREYQEFTLLKTVNREMDTRFAQIRWAHQVDSNEEVSLQLYFNTENKKELFDVISTTLAPIPIRIIADNRVHGERYDLEFQHSLSVTASTRMVWGLGARQDSTYGVDVFGTNTATGYTGGRKVFYNKMVRAFGNLEWRALDKLLVNAGAMLEDSDLASNQLSPRLGFNYLFNPENAIRFTMSRATRTPTLRENHDNYRVPIYDAASPQPLLGITTLWIGNQDMNPEVITAYELGYHANLQWKKVSFDLKLYKEELRDLISPDQNQVPDPTDIVDGKYEIVDNLTDSNITGTEIGVEISPTADSRVIFSHSTIHIESQNPNISSDQLAKSAPEYITSIMVLNRFTSDITGSFLYTNISKSDGLGSGDAVDGHRRLDFRLGVEFGTRKFMGELAFVVQNLLDGYTDWSTSPGEDHIFDTRHIVNLSMQWY